MSRLMKVAFGCYLVAALLLLVFGLVYLFRPEFMPYHAVALDKEWSAVERPYQVFTLSLYSRTAL